MKVVWNDSARVNVSIDKFPFFGECEVVRPPVMFGNFYHSAEVVNVDDVTACMPSYEPEKTRSVCNGLKKSVRIFTICGEILRVRFLHVLEAVVSAHRIA